MNKPGKSATVPRLTRRRFLAAGVTAAAVAAGWGLLGQPKERCFIARVPEYKDLLWRLRAGMKELGIGAAALAGKRILL